MMPKLNLPKLPNLGPRERTLVLAGAVIVGLTISDKLLISPWWQHTRRMSQQISELKQQTATHQRLLTRQPEVDAAMQAYRDYVRLARAAEVEMAELIREVEVLGSDSGITLGTVTPLPPAENWPRQEYSMDVQYTGSLQESVRFLYLLESSKKLFELQRLTLGLEKKGGERLQGTIRLVSMAVIGNAPAASTGIKP